jgi:hypothetical protein
MRNFENYFKKEKWIKSLLLFLGPDFESAILSLAIGMRREEV